MYGSRTTIETIDTKQDRAAQFPRQLWSSFSNMRDAIVPGILVISTPFLRPASACVHFERPVHVWEPHHHETIDTNQDRATEVPRQLWSSFSNMRDANVHGILAISTPFLQPASASVVSKQCMYGSRTTIETIDTNRDRAWTTTGHIH